MSRKHASGRPQGPATVSGTARFAARHKATFVPDFFRALGREGLLVSSVGIGTYLGECDDTDDERYVRTIRSALESGINLLDTAINYRCQRSERAVGRALRAAIDHGSVTRDEIVVCTKGGYVPLDGQPPATRAEYQAYLSKAYFDAGVITPGELVAGGHCLSPQFLAHEIAASRENLSVETIDVYYLHNPEHQLDTIRPAEFRARMEGAFSLLETECREGRIGCYGCATWNGFRVQPSSRGHLSLAELVEIARQVGGESHHFQVLQLPVNLALAEAVRAPTQRLADGRMVSLIEAAMKLGVSVVASAVLLQGKLSGGLPPELREALPGLATDSQRAIAFVRSVPGIASGLAGMKSQEHLLENLGAATILAALAER